MVDPNNPGQFGNRSDDAASKGDKASSDKQDMSKLGKKGAAAQSTADKAKGGRRSHSNR